MKRLHSATKFGIWLFLVLLFTGLFGILFTDQQVPQSVWAYGDNLQEKLRVFRLILETVRQSYVEERSIDELMEAAVKGMLADLDPHTNYLPADNFQQWNKNFEGFNGIGIRFLMVNGYPMITGFLPESPAAKSNLRPGDVILEIDGNSTYGKTRSEVEQALMDDPFAGIRLTVVRSSSPQRTLQVNLPRTHLIIPSISGAFLLGNGIGYVALDRFTGTTAQELDRALDRLLEKGMQGLILDLRDNGGGYLSAAVEVADRFLPRGRLIVYTKGRLDQSFQEYHARASYPYESLPLVVLVNHGTASAAEIVAGAIQDWDRGLIVGTTTFGKGLVQSQYRFRDGSALLVTTAKYYTPVGRCIQRDYFGLSKDEYYADAYTNISLQASRERCDATFRTPQGRTVYGGGGIIPDIWSDNAKAVVEDVVRELYFSRDGWLLKFAADLLKQRKELHNLPAQKFSRLRISDRELRAFLAYLNIHHVSIGQETFWKHAEDIRFLLQRELAYLAAGEEARFRVNLQRDSQLQQAIDAVPAAAQLSQGEAVAHVIGSHD